MESRSGSLLPAAPAVSDESATVGRAPDSRRLVASYARADNRRGMLELLWTAVPFFGLVAALFYGLDHGIWAAVALILPAAAFLVRLFIIQHDCGHGSYFRSRRANDMLGRAIGIFTLTPYASWRQDHAVHHATSGNLSRRGIGDVTTLTVREYLSRPFTGRLLYRLYRHPLVLFAVGPAYQFLIRHRIASGSPAGNAKAWRSAVGTNLVLAAIAAAVAVMLGWQPLVYGYLPVILLAGSIGVWLFYVQHQFEDTYWEPEPVWDFRQAALEGCSYYDLPRLLHWLTGHIGLHHVHHLACRIPSYRLRAAFEEIPAMRAAKRLGVRESLRCARLALWDEAQRKLIGFSDIRR